MSEDAKNKLLGILLFDGARGFKIVAEIYAAL